VRSLQVESAHHVATYNPLMSRSSTRRLASLTVFAFVTAAASCSSDAASPPSTLSPTTTTVARADEGVLTIGVLKPQGSANADIGQAIGTAVQLAVDTINNAGGYNGHNVELIPEDEGVAGVGIDPAIATLLNRNVDAIIGPASSANALAGLGEIVNAGVVACSPTASASLLDGFPDHNLFFRTIPSDSLQAVAIAKAVDQTGASQTAVAFIDDAYGQAFADSVEAALQKLDITVSLSVPYSAGNQSIDVAAKKIAGTSDGVIVVIGDATSGPVMLGEIDTAAGKARPSYMVNDAMRRPNASAHPMGASLALRVHGISPVAYSTDQDFVARLGATPDDPSPYAANAFDCVNLIALAALAGQSTQPAVIASLIPAVSDGGSPCMTFASCRDDIALGSNINYDGPGGSLAIGSDGDLTSATFELFGFDETGRDVDEQILTANR
jgi:branched-chain amino acid transport system substrate-binding protein